MKCIYIIIILQLAIGAVLLSPMNATAQCMSYPVSLQERTQHSNALLFGKVTDQHCYEDSKGNIYTLNKVSVTAWLKNYRAESTVFIITLGGTLGNKAQITYPAIQLDKNAEYFFMLEADNNTADDKATRAAHPGAVQALPFADAQGAWLYQRGKYHDIYVEGAVTEQQLMDKITGLTGEQAKKPDGTSYIARPGITLGTSDITSFSPNPTAAGTINPAHFLTINGSGFGTAPGTVTFPNADNGGATQVTPPNASDYVTWTDNTIVVKVPTGSSSNAGSGFFTVNNFFTPPTALTIAYSHLSINSTFSAFPSETRQRYYLRNLDGFGGYTFRYHNSFISNTDATAAFERALSTWRCSTGINWRSSGMTFSAYADDGENVVLFDASLPSGVLARATSRFNGSATSSCNLHNTVWWLKEIDIQARPTGITWQYGPAPAVGSQFDFETVLLHELGHAHGLGHRIAFGQLMNYSVGPATNIRTPAPPEIQGGLDKMAYSTVPTCFNPSQSGTEMITYTGSECVTPVKLLSFTGVVKSTGIDLNWRTASEINTDRFEVQRSHNGIEFTTIGSVAAVGNSTIERTYNYLDAAPLAGLNYYRLKIVDKDASFEYSATINFKYGGSIKGIGIAPNPAITELRISSPANTQLVIIDAEGRIMQRLSIHAGMNIINVSRYSNGVYYIVDQRTGEKTRLLIMPK